MARKGEIMEQSVFIALALLLSAVGTVGQTTAERKQEDMPVISGCTVPVVIFGASMMDVGELAVLQPDSTKADFPPYGVDYFNFPVGRFSNGRVITDFISSGLGYGFLDNYLNAFRPRFTHGVNFACSGSTARNSTQSGSTTSGILPLDVQVKQYEVFKAKVQSAYAKHAGCLSYLPTPRALSRAIHVMEHGHNDYINALYEPPYEPLSVVTSVIEAMGSSLRELYNMGVKTMVVMNLLPLGCTPSLLAHAETTSATLDNDSCVAEYNSLADLHNLHLQQLIDQLRVELTWNELVIFDLNAVYIDAVRNPSKYGVEYPLQACCGVGGKYNMDATIPCGSKGTLDGVVVEAGRCSSPPEYISWDGLHPTESFAKHIAIALLNGNYFHPNLSMQDACKGALNRPATRSTSRNPTIAMKQNSIAAAST